MTATPNSTTFYVYALARPIKKDWKIFYIGKGTKRRVFRHELEARRGCICWKCRTIRKAWREGGEIQRYILLTTEDEQEAFDYEKEMIALHGRGNLCNQTDGGEGSSGWKATEEDKKKRSEVNRRTHKADPTIRARIREAQRLRFADPAARAKQSTLLKQIYTDPEMRRQAGVGSKRAWQDPVMREKRIAGIREYVRTPERREQMKAESERRWADPEYRAKTAASIKAVTSTPEARKQRSERAKRRYADPAEREKTRQAVKAGKARARARNLDTTDSCQ